MQKRAAMQKRLQAAKQSQKQWTPPPIRLPEAVIEKPKAASAKKTDNITTGKIYSEVLKKERNPDQFNSNITASKDILFEANDFSVSDRGIHDQLSLKLV